MKFQKKPFIVDAVQVTDENISEVAAWCQGEVIGSDGDALDELYIFVRVHNPMNERQTKAFVGDWVLYAGRGYKVYRDRAMKNTFEQIAQDVDELVAVADNDE